MPADADRPPPGKVQTNRAPRSVRRLRVWLRRLGGVVSFGLTALGVLAIAVITTRHQLAHPDHARFPVRGVDVSHHQGAIDWHKVAQSHVQFAFIKATEGADHRDTLFQRNWQASAAAGMHRGAYHFFTFCSPGAAQAAHFISAVPPGQPMLPPAVDVEYAGNCANPPKTQEIRRELTVMLERLTVVYGRKPILYTTNEARLRLLRSAFNGYPLWIRNVYAPPWVFGVSDWTFWQHDDEGQLSGVATPVDLNVFHGDASLLRACFERGECEPEAARAVADESAQQTTSS